MWNCRANDAIITLFVAPQALLMQAPVVGPLIYVPMQFAIAWLLNFLLTQQQQAASGQAVTHSEHHPSAFQAAPTKPEPLQQGHYPRVDIQQTGAATSQQGFSGPVQATAPPWNPSHDSRAPEQYPLVHSPAPSGIDHAHQRPGEQIQGAPGLPVV